MRVIDASFQPDAFAEMHIALFLSAIEARPAEGASPP